MLIERIVAPNPGPMTLTGTNTYLVGDGSGALAAIDPGPNDAAHLSAILAAASRLGRITTVIVTHRHLDHLPAALPLCRQTGASFVGHANLPGVQRPIGDNERVFGDLIALETPGHTRDSLSLWDVADEVVFTGDLVLGTGTAVLDDAPDALVDYLRSLQRLVALSPKRIYPGHGPIVEDAVGKLTEYIEHRQQRVQQVLDALGARGPSSADELAAAIYTELAPHLLPMAARNVRANLDLLVGQHRVAALPGQRWQLSA
ncbi:MAG TPA: MBL fold metallo-hydrolase [Chloroflexota bacterium]